MPQLLTTLLAAVRRLFRQPETGRMEPRPIREAEARVIETALERARRDGVEDFDLESIRRLVVTGRCGCGCASVDFDGLGAGEFSRILADGLGTTPRGGQVGVIVWGSPTAIAGLEIFDRGAGDDDLVLPVLETIVSYEESMPG